MKFLHQLARANVRNELRSVKLSGLRRWRTILACSAALSLLEQRTSLGSAGPTPSPSKVVRRTTSAISEMQLVCQWSGAFSDSSLISFPPLLPSSSLPLLLSPELSKKLTRKTIRRLTPHVTHLIRGKSMLLGVGERVARRDPRLAIAEDLDLLSAVDLTCRQPIKFNK